MLMVGSKFVKNFRLVKVDEASHTAYGLATSEAVDSENEIADYEGSKEAFTKWSVDFMNRTQSAGQAVSLGNIRIQHNAGDVGGKATRIDFRDDTKEVYVESVPINDDVWNMLQGGFLTGYSIGGRVTKTKKEGKLLRYWFTLSELSYVDNPANPDATFTYVKANGSIELRKFRRSPETVLDDIAANAKKAAQEFSEGVSMALFTPEQLAQIEHVMLKKDGKTKRVAGEDLPSSAFAYVGDKEDPSTWKLPLHFSSEEKSKRHVRNALARFDQTKDIPDDKKESVHAKIAAAAKKCGIDVEGEKAKAEEFHDLVKAALKKSYGDDEVKKSMWDIGVLANLVQDLSYLYWSRIYEAMWEEDDRDDVLAVEIAAAVEHLVVILKDMLEEDSSELIPALKAAQELKLQKGENAMVDEILDFAAELADLAKSGHTNKANFKKMAAKHEFLAARHEKMAARHEKIAASHAEMEPAHKAHKAIASEHTGIQSEHVKCMDAHKAMAEQCKAMADNCDQESDSEKAAKAAAAVTAKAAADAAAAAATPEALAKAAADKVVADKAIADAAAAAPVVDPTLAGVLADLKKSIDASNEVSAKLQKSVEGMLAAPIVPGTPAAKNAGLELVGRSTPPLAKTATADVGI